MATIGTGVGDGCSSVAGIEKYSSCVKEIQLLMCVRRSEGK